MTTALSNDDRLAVAMIAAMKAWPYFSCGLASLVRRFADLKPFHTMAVTREGVLLVDPKFLEAVTPKVAAMALAHELQHLLRRHAERSDGIPGVDRLNWNLAGDCAINDDFRDPPAEWATPKRFGLKEGLIEEEYYAQLMQQSQQQGGGGKGKSGEGDGGDGQPGDAPGKGGVGAGQCGSGAGGEPVDGEPQGAAGAPGRSDADLDRMRRSTADAIVEHAQKGRGDVPAGLLRWAQAQLKPAKVRWQDKLRRAVRATIATAAGKLDYTRTRPSRRQSALDALAVALGRRGPIMPSLCAPKPRVAFGVDTSGSMGTDELLRAVSEADAVLKATGAPVTFLDCDCAVQGPPRQVRSARELAKLLRGGGGTDFHPIFEAVQKLRPAPSVFIFVTDGQGPAPAEPLLGIHTIWILVGPYATAPVTWGEQIVVTED